MSQLVAMFAAHALTGLCANPHHKQDEHPNTDSLAVVDRAFALGNAMAAKFAAEEPVKSAALTEDDVRRLIGEAFAAPSAEEAPAVESKTTKKRV